MRRAAVQALRAARRSHARRYLTQRSTPSPLSPRVHGTARSQIERYYSPQPHSILQSSMYFRSLTIAIVSSLVASGAWFAYREKPGDGVIGPLTTSLSQSSPFHASTTANSAAFATGIHSALSSSTVTAEAAAETRRKALVVDNDQLFTGDIEGDQPLSKEVDGSGRLVMEMLDDAQSTAKLRNKEQSYLVGRGQGVLRYDLTQLPSNSPIEDDHVERIIQVPQTIAPPVEGATTSDWMFWGVFDGHR